MTSEEIKKLKGKYNNYEMSLFLSHGEGKVSEKTFGRWVNGDRAPRGPALALLCIFKNVMEDGSLTREEILSKAGYGLERKSTSTEDK